ncbi:MAG: cache domain-containing protein, partial [Marinobacterium sp.]
MFFKNLRVRAKLWLLIGIAGFMLLFLTSTALLDMRHSLQQEREAQLNSLLDTTLSLTASLQARVAAGELSSDEARQQARTLLENMRYAGNEYFFVLNANADILVHGGDTSQAGRNLKSARTPDGVPVFAQMAAMIGDGKKVEAFSYLWPKAGSTEPQPKLTLAKSFEPWGWVIGTGVYMDDLNAAFMEDLIHLSLQLLVALA